MVWKVRILGNDFDLAELARSLSNDQISVTKEQNDYYLKHESFQNCQTDEEVREKASRLIVILNGATLIQQWLRCKNLT